MVGSLEGEMSRRRKRGNRMRRRRRRSRGGGYALGFGAGNKLVRCTERRRGQVEFSSDRAPEYPSPQARHQRHKVMLWRLRRQIMASSCTLFKNSYKRNVPTFVNNGAEG